MPKITEYNAPEGLAIRPTETGIESTAAAARRVGGAYSEIAQLTKETGRQIGSAIQEAGTVATNYIADAEISRGAAAFAGLMNSKTKQWRDTNQSADPNDPTVAQNYQQGLEGDLAKFKSGFITEKGQAWAEHHIEQLRNHLYAKSGADRGTAAGQAVKINAETTVQGLANGAMWDATEKGLQTSLSALETSGLPKATIEEGKKEIIARNAHGYIQQNATIPDYIKKDEYRGYIDARALKQLETTERQTRRDNVMADKVAKQQTEYTAKQQFNADADKLYRDTLPVNNDSRPQLPPDAMDRVRKMDPGPDAPPSVQKDYRALVNHINTVAERLNKPEPVATQSHRSLMGLLPRIRSGEVTDLSEIDDLATPSKDHPNGQLNTNDWNVARKEFTERKGADGVPLSRSRGDFFKDYQRAIDPAVTTLGYRSALGDEQMHKANMDARLQEDALRKAGKNPQVLYDPTSPEFFGKPENLRKYAVSLQQIQEYEAAQRKGAPAPSATPTVPQPVVPVAPRPTVPGPGARADQDYDMAGAIAAGVKPDERGHYPDTYKLPNHITFSDDSKYSNEQHPGGHWAKQDGAWTFTPGPENFKHHSLQELQDYFRRNEPDAKLIIARPTSAAERDALQKGVQYIAPDGSVRTR